MSKLSKSVTAIAEHKSLQPDKIVTNFMGGDSYKVNPLLCLKMITASSIFGEPSYYRKNKVQDGKYYVDDIIGDDDILSNYNKLSTTEIMESAIDDALSYDFKSTLNWAAELRTVYNMRLNPQVIMVRAAMHPYRKSFTSDNPGEFNRIQQIVMSRADEPLTQLTYYLFKNEGNKSKLPSILKRSIGHKLSQLNNYQVNKYKNHEIGMINGVRLTHANSSTINELMSTGKVEVSESQMTWEMLRSKGKSWFEIINSANVPHMALLRNLRNVFTEINHVPTCQGYLTVLKKGVKNGKQFPFRYYAAMSAINSSNCNHKVMILDALEDCIDIAIENLPKLKGRTMCLSDNSGSAWGAFTSEYGSNEVAKIGNLSSVITAMNCDEGYVGKFGDRLKTYGISKRQGALNQANYINESKGRDVGFNTEGGIWEFFQSAIDNREHYDNIFIYSDQQAGTGGLYGTDAQYADYGAKYGTGRRYINVFKLVQDYRKYVNPKVNVFSVQTAGYDNVLIPEIAYRTHILYGWTGQELVYADKMIKLWNEAEQQK